MIAVHDPRYFADLGHHVMPIRKFALVRDAIAASGLPCRWIAPEPATDADLLRVHTEDYVRAVATGIPRDLAESQKFPWSAALADSVRWTNGGCITALRAALDHGIAGNLASGFHHAHADHGEGFCTFNGLVVALEAVRAERGPLTALVVDLDLHFGNGTADLARTRLWLHQLSVYGNHYDRNRAIRDVTSAFPTDRENTRSIPVPAGTDGPGYLGRIGPALEAALDRVQPDVVLYQAGADPLRDDPYSPLDLGAPDLWARDRLVFGAIRRRGLPVMWVLAGGYTPEIARIVEVHLNTYRASTE